MTRYYCYECKNAYGECKYPCEYVDPVGELHNADHIKCEIGDAVWVQEKCKCCGHNVQKGIILRDVIEIPPTYGKKVFRLYYIPEDEPLEEPKLCTQELEWVIV